MKKRIAIWTHGGIGSGMYSQGQPCIHRLIKRLAAHYTIDVYMQLTPNRDFLPQGFGLYTAKSNIKWGILRWLNLFFLFMGNHRKKKYDLFYSVWGYPAGVVVVLLGKLFSRPCVIHLQGGDAAYVPSLDYGVFSHPVRRKLCVWVYSQCNTLIALTGYQTQCLRRFGITRPIQIIPYGVDTDIFSYQPLRSKSQAIRCLHVGNQTPVKNQETLVRAFAAVVRKVPATLTFIGADHNDGRLRRLCSDLRVDEYVTFLGPQPYEELPSYYHGSDVLMLTSMYEGQGLVFTEAAACGTLLAGTGVGILSDMGEDCGIISPDGDVETFAAKIVEILNSPARLDAKKTAARRWVVEKNEDFTVGQIVGELNRLLYQS